jgi:hypothetical protein
MTDNILSSLLMLCLVGCGSAEDADTGVDALGMASCGTSDGSVFDIEIGRVSFAPTDAEGERWDIAEADGVWAEDLAEWRELSRSMSTQGRFQRGSYADVEKVNAYFESTLFSETAAPDPVAVLYETENAGKRWKVAQEWGQIAGNSYQVGGLYLGRWTLGGGNRVLLRFLDADAPDQTRIGDLQLTGVLAQSLAGCGPMSIVLSEPEMRGEDSRVHAIEIEVRAVR